MTKTDPVPLSALQHWMYCPRQCGLIHREQAFEDNIHTARGQALHHLVDTPGYEIKSGVRVERALPVWSDPLNLIGKADLVEFHPDGSVYPVEFKHGAKRQKTHDNIQQRVRGGRSGFATRISTCCTARSRRACAGLALDLQEEFWSMLADRLALTLINRGQINAADFDEREGGAVLLKDKGRRAVVTAWQERKQEEITHPPTESKVPIGLLPFIQARFMARTIRGEMESYLPYVAK